MAYYELQQRVYQNKARRNFNLTEVGKEIILITEEFGELCAAYLENNVADGIDAIGDIAVYGLGLSAMFEQNIDAIVRDVSLPSDLSKERRLLLVFDEYFFIGKEIGMLAKTYKQSNKRVVSEIDQKDVFVKHIGNLVMHCITALRLASQDPVKVLEQIINTNETRTHKGQM